MTIEQITAERDRLRAALEEIRRAFTHCGQRSPRAILEDALANTTPAPVDSVKAELLAALETLVSEADQTGGRIRNVHRHTVDKARAALAKAEKAGG